MNSETDQNETNLKLDMKPHLKEGEQSKQNEVFGITSKLNKM